MIARRRHTLPCSLAPAPSSKERGIVNLRIPVRLNRDRPKPVSAEIFCIIVCRIFCRNIIVNNCHYSGELQNILSPPNIRPETEYSVNKPNIQPFFLSLKEDLCPSAALLQLLDQKQHHQVGKYSGIIMNYSRIFGILAEYSVFHRILGIRPNILPKPNSMHFEIAEYSFSADSRNRGFGRSLRLNYSAQERWRERERASKGEYGVGVRSLTVTAGRRSAACSTPLT